MAKLSTLNVPVREGGETSMRSLDLATLSSLVLPVKSGDTVTNVEFELPGGSTPETEQIEVTATTVDQVVTPTPGKLIDEVTVHPQVQDDVYVYPENSVGGTVDFGATNNYRKVNAANVYSKGVADGTPSTETKEVTATTSDQVITPTTGKLISQVTVHPQVQTDTYTYPANSTGATYDFGATNNYRKVNAENVYAKGVADGVSPIVIGVHTGTSSLYGKTCRLKNSGGTVLQTKTISNAGNCQFGLSSAGTYTVEIVY